MQTDLKRMDALVNSHASSREKLLALTLSAAAPLLKQALARSMQPEMAADTLTGKPR
jgi:hypothetical protein